MARRRDDTELSKMAAQGVDGLGALTDPEVTRPEDHRVCLLLRSLHGYEPHGWPRRRLGDSLGISSVVLLPLDEGFDVDRRQQPDLMSERADFGLWRSFRAD